MFDIFMYSITSNPLLIIFIILLLATIFVLPKFLKLMNNFDVYGISIVINKLDISEKNGERFFHIEGRKTGFTGYILDLLKLKTIVEIKNDEAGIYHAVKSPILNSEFFKAYPIKEKVSIESAYKRNSKILTAITILLLIALFLIMIKSYAMFIIFLALLIFAVAAYKDSKRFYLIIAMSRRNYFVNISFAKNKIENGVKINFETMLELKDILKYHILKK